MKNLDGSKGPLRKYLHMCKRHPFNVMISPRRNYAHPRSSISSCCSGETGQLSAAFHSDVELSGHTSHASPKSRWAEPHAEWEPGSIPSRCSQHWDPVAHLRSGLLCAPMWRQSPSELWCGSGIGAPHCKWGTTELTSQPCTGAMPFFEKNILVVLFPYFFFFFPYNILY